MVVHVVDTAPVEIVENEPPVIAVNDLDPFAFFNQHVKHGLFDGDKFFGGFGTTNLYAIDYWTLRKRSSQLFNDNLYARGLIRRLVTNEINTGLTPESSPDEDIIGVPVDSLNAWTELVETRFGVWAKNPRLCDFKRRDTYGALQRNARAEALISGDVLFVLRQSPVTKLPSIQLVSGDKVQNPFNVNQNVRKGHRIIHGVELNALGRVVAHWVQQDDGSSKRIPAFGEKSGRRISWLVYGTDKRLDDVRGQPLLSLMLQSLKEIDRYRDSTQRKAVLNSIIAMYLKKTEDKMSTLPVTGGAVRRDQVTTTDSDGATRSFDIANQIPGVVMEELQTGEEPVPIGGQGTDLNFGLFEETIMATVAWGHEVPPEILRLAFSNNYSASQAAINEFKIYLNKVWSGWGEEANTPVFVEWLIAETLLGKIQSPGFLQAWRDPLQYDVFGAWTTVEWYGSIKPSTDMLKQAKGSQLLTKNGWSTNAREARATTGTKFSKNVKRLTRENQQKADMMRPLLELQAEFPTVSGGANEALSALLQDNIQSMEDLNYG